MSYGRTVMLNYHVLLEAAWLVKDVKSVDDARGVAISEAGKRLNPKLNYVDVNIGVTACPLCGGKLDSVFVAANTALVGLLFEMRVFAAESEEHAARIAKSVIGQALKNVPLKVVEVDQLEEKKD